MCHCVCCSYCLLHNKVLEFQECFSSGSIHRPLPDLAACCSFLFLRSVTFDTQLRNSFKLEGVKKGEEGGTLEKQQTFPQSHRNIEGLGLVVKPPAMGRDATLVRLPMPPSSLALNTSRHL